MNKRTKKDVKLSSTEVGVLIEALRAEIKPVLEAIPDMQKKLDSVFEQLGKNTEKLGVLEIAVNRILEELKSKVDRRDFETLEKKVTSLIS